jgi:tetratricopeptide (TPR) repeat protein
VAVYLNSLGLGIAADAAVLLRDTRIQALTPDNLGRIFTEPYWPAEFQLGLFRPLTTLSLLLNYAVLGNGSNGFGWHALNLLIHLLNVWFVYTLARRVQTSQRTAWFTAAMWAVHPAGVESVTNIAGRADLLAAAAVLGGMVWYARRTSEASAGVPVTAAGIFAIACAGVFAKESAAVLPGLMLLWDMTAGPGWRDWKRRVPCYAAALLAGTLFFALRPHMPPMLIPVVDNPEIGAGFLAARLTALKVIGQYVLLLLFPLHLSSDYSYNEVPIAGVGDPVSWIAPIAIAAVLAAVVIRRRRDPVLFFGAGWFGVALLPVSNLLVIIGAIKAERFLYLPAIGFAFACAALLERAAGAQAGRRDREVVAAAVLVLVLFGLRTVVRNPDWKDDPTLWTSNLAGAPNSHKVHKNIASALNSRDPLGTLDEATRHLERAWTLVRDLPMAEWPESVLLDLGVCYRLKGDKEGRAWYLKSVDFLGKAQEVARLRHARGGPPADYPQVYINLGLSQTQLGNTAAAIEAYRQGQRVDPRNAFFYDSIGRLYSQKEDVVGAARITLEQYLAGAGDANTPDRLRALFGLLPDGACAFRATGLSPDCPRVRTEACAVGGNVVAAFEAARQPDAALRVREVLTGTYGCGHRE